MQIGIPWWIGSGSAVEGVRAAGSIGVDFVEISLDAPWPEGLRGPEIRAAADDADVDVGFHAPWRTQALAHPRPVLAQAAREVAQSCLDLALTAGAAYVVFHVDARDFGRFPVERVLRDGLERAQASLAALSSGAGEDVSILVENTSSPMGTPSEIASFLEPLPDVGFCYDPGHATMVEMAKVEGATSDPRAWTKALGDRLEVLHAMDQVRTDGNLVDHLVPGAGEADLASLLEASREAGCQRVLMEAFFRNVDRDEATLDDLAKAGEHLQTLL